MTGRMANVAIMVTYLKRDGSTDSKIVLVSGAELLIDTETKCAEALTKQYDVEYFELKRITLMLED